MDSSGLRLVVVADQRARAADRRFAVIRGPETVHRVFEITRVAERLEFIDDPDEASQ
jgi:anti-anti-sigma regulatory factor